MTIDELDKLPKPTNVSLKLLFADADTIVIKEGGVHYEKAMSDKVVLTLTDENSIKRISELLEIDEVRTGFYCMCSGTYGIEVFSNGNLKTTIGYHHGVSIRYIKWNSDATLILSDQLLEFLSEKGLTKPLQDSIEDNRRREAYKLAEANWLEMSPKCFTKYWTQINSYEKEYLPSLINDLNLEFADQQKQIITLLQIFGTSENLWSAYLNYELLPASILMRFEISEIIDAYLNSDRNDKIIKGLGRFLCSYEFKKIRKKYLKFIPEEVISDLEKCFDSIGEKRGINEIFSLRNEKAKSI